MTSGIKDKYWLMRKFKIVGLVLPLLVLSGCADTQKYPIGWPEPVASLPGGCASLVGVYSATDSDSRLFLDYFSGTNNARTSEIADRFQITVPAEGSLEIVAYRQEAVVAQRQFSEQDKTLSCGPTEAALTYYSGFDGEDGGFCYSKIMRSLSKDRDGFLMVKAESSCFGAYGDTPIGGKNISWLRLHPKGL